MSTAHGTRPGDAAAAERLDELRRQVTRTLEAGLRVPCLEEPAGFTSDDHEQRAAAARLCEGCPLLEDCASYALAAREPFGVWAGVDLTPTTGRGSGLSRLAAAVDARDQADHRGRCCDDCAHDTRASR